MSVVDSPVRYAIVGCGVIGPVHADAVTQHPSAELVGVCDILPERAQSCAERFGGRAYADCAEMLECERPQAISVCTPHNCHAEVAVQGLEAGAHVLCEKPLDGRPEAMDRMIDAARRTGCLLAGVFQHRFDPVSATIKRAIDAGMFGRLLNAGATIRCTRTEAYYGSAAWRGTWAGEGGAVLINQAIHSIDMMQWLAGRVKTVCGRWANLTHEGVIEAEDAGSAWLEFENGALGTIEATSSSHMDFDSGVHVYGTEGSARVATGWPNDVTWLDMESESAARELREMLSEAAQQEAVPTVGKLCYGNSHVRQVADFVEAVRDARPPHISAESARHAVQIVHAVYESSRLGRPVTL